MATVFVRAGDEIDFLVAVKRTGDAVARAVDVHHLARLGDAVDGCQKNIRREAERRQRL